MRILIILLSIFIYSNTIGQTLSDLDTLYNNKRFAEVTMMAAKLEDTDEATMAYAYHMAGMSYLQLKKNDSTIFCEQAAITNDHENSWISAWGYIDIGQAYLNEGKGVKAVTPLQKVVDLNKTANSVDMAKHMLNYIVHDMISKNSASPPQWVMMEGEHITYYFQDTTAITDEDKKTYIAAHEAAYNKINSIFQAKLPNKMIFYVWKDRARANRVLGHDLGFTHPETCVTNTSIDQTIGHEMTHTLAYWAWGKPPVNETRFINEGVAVAFDMNNKDKYEVARAAVAGTKLHSVLELWKDEKASEKQVYPVGGAFLTYLFKKSTKEQFKSIVKNQIIENARKVYGAMTFDKMVADFNKMIGLK